MKKILLGATFGVLATTVVANFTYKKMVKKFNAELENLKNEKNDFETRYSVLKEKCKNLCSMNNGIIKNFNIITDPNMLADIANIKNIELRDKCLSEIENTVSLISKHIIHESDDISIDDISKFNEYVSSMTKNIEDFLDEYDDEDDEEETIEIEEDINEEDGDTETASPKKLILKGIDCQDKIFETDPDIGYEVINGSDTENNDYCIYAQNDAKLYNFLKESIKEQLSSHYIAKIDPEIFEDITEDLMITVSFSFINETDAEITEVAAVIPFEIFNKKNKYYQVKECEINNDKLVYLNRGNIDSSDSVSRTENLPEPCKEESEEKAEMIKYEKPPISNNMDDNIQYLVETIGFNRDALKSFIKKLDILQKANPEAGTTYYESFTNIIFDIIEHKTTGKLDNTRKSNFCIQIQTLIRNMKRNYGPDINLYSQTH